MARISFNGVAESAHRHKRMLLREFARVIDHGVFLNGRENLRLEKKLLTTLKARGHLTTVASGHDALFLSLQALHLPKGSEVICPVNAYPTAFPIALSGTTVVPVDVDQNGQMDPAALQKAITKKTRVIILVHLYGLLGDIASIRQIAKSHHLVLIEDAAQAFGTSYKGEYVGTLGDIGCFSFYPTKNLGALGDGGAVFTKKNALFKYIVQSKLYGERIRYESDFISGHSRLPELQAAGLLTYLTSHKQAAARRQKVAAWYRALWQKIGLARYGYILSSHPDSTSVPHLLVVSMLKRNGLQRYLSHKKITASIHYPYPIHRVRSFRNSGISHRSYPVAETLSKRILSLPLHPYMRKSDVHAIVSAIKTYYDSHLRP